MEGGPLVEDVRLPTVAASHRVVHKSAAANGNRDGGHGADMPGPPCHWVLQLEASLHKEPRSSISQFLDEIQVMWTKSKFLIQKTWISAKKLGCQPAFLADQPRK